MSDAARSVELVGQWREGDQAAAEELYRRYSQRLWELARRQIGVRLGRRVGPEDIVQSVFRTFFRRTEEGQFCIEHTCSLWQLLVRITLNKVRRQVEHHTHTKRDVNAEAVLPADQPDGELFFARGPTCDDATALLDEMEFMVGGLGPTAGEMVRLTLEGHSTEDIATRLGCSRWTVRRVLDRFGQRLRKRLRGNPQS